MSQIEAAESYKLLGNSTALSIISSYIVACFKNEAYSDAIVEYTKAIVPSLLPFTHIEIHNPANVAYFTNRALCFLKLNQYSSVIQDCEHAILLDSSNVKAHSMLGQALMRDESRLGEAVARLTKAYNLAVSQRASSITEINQHYRNAKRALWSVDEEARLLSESKQYAQLKACVKSSKKDVDESEELLKYVDHLLENDKHARKRQIPEYFLGKITLEIMTDPVITPCGITYDRVEILQHLSRIGAFDPLSRAYLTESQLIPNLALKECIDEYLKHNGWALDF